MNTSTDSISINFLTMRKGASMLQNFQKINKDDKKEYLQRPVLHGRLKPRKKGKAQNSLNNQKGFTLVELLVAITLMVIGIFAVLGMQLIALQSNSIANQLSVATSLASEALEDVSSSAWSDNGTGISNGTTTLKYDGTDNTYLNYPYPSGGLYTISCFPANNTPITGIARLDVTVAYTYKGNIKSVRMTGYKRML
jgi:prepilin-type N-terminal cleavage/methylation domain-containing protein